MVMVASISRCSHWCGSGARRPRHLPGVGTCSPDTGQMRRVDPGVDQPPHRGRGRHGTEDMFTIPAALPDTVDAVRAVGQRGGQIGEHRTRLIHPRASIGVGQRGRDLPRQPGQIRQLPHHAHPGVRHHTMTIRGHPSNRCGILHLRSAFPLASWTFEKSHYALQDRHFRLSTHPERRNIHVGSGAGAVAWIDGRSRSRW